MAERKMTAVEDPNPGRAVRLYATFKTFGDNAEGYYAAETEETGGQYGPQTVYDLITEDGGILGVTGTADIRAKMAQVGKGTFVRIEFTHERPANKEGRSPMKVFAVTTDASDRLSEAEIAKRVAAAVATASGAPKSDVPF